MYQLEFIKSEIELFQLPPTEKTTEQYVWQNILSTYNFKNEGGEPIIFEIVTG